MQTIKKVLPEIFNRVEWLTELPKDFKGVVIANEVLDAIPAKRIAFSEGYFVELGVDFQNENVQWKKFTQPYVCSAASLPDVMEEGYTTETNVQSIAWIKSLYDSIS